MSTSGSSTSRRMLSAAGVPPGSLVKRVEGSEPARSGSRARTSVDLPEKSRPSIVTKMPLDVSRADAEATLPVLGRSAAVGVTLGRGDVGLEEVPVLRSRLAHGFGVPLHPDQPPLRQVARLDRLYNPVWRVGYRDQAGGQILYRLVVVGVDLELVSAKDLGDPGVSFHLYLVRRLPLGRLLAMPEQDHVIHLRGKVLVERPP